MNKTTEDLIEPLSYIDKLFANWGDYPSLDSRAFCGYHNQEDINKYHKNYQNYQNIKSMNKIMVDYCLTHKGHMSDELINIFYKVIKYSNV